MMEGIEKKIVQIAVRFGCAIPLRPELKPSEVGVLKEALQALDPEHFQLFGNIMNPANPNAPILFSSQRQYQIDAGLVTGPSMTFEPSSIAVLHAVKIGDKYLVRDKDFKGSEHNRKAREALFKIQEITKVKFNRAGKIYEFIFGPFDPAEKDRLLKNLLALSSSSNICEVQLVFTRAVQGKEKLLNLNTQIQFNQAQLEHPIQVLVKVDINNRKLEQSLEQRDVDNIWKEADDRIEEHIEELLGVEG